MATNKTLEALENLNHDPDSLYRMTPKQVKVLYEASESNEVVLAGVVRSELRRLVGETNDSPLPTDEE